jgi:orotate phosphoribosyltransferase
MIDDLLKTLPLRQGHFLLESGYHADLWFTLDGLFAKPRDLEPFITALTDRIASYRPTAICGPLLGGAFLAQAVAIKLGVDFYYSEPVANDSPTTLFSAAYVLPAELQQRARGQHVALVDDVISAGSSVRATAVALKRAEARIVAVGTLLLLGTQAADHFASVGVPVEALGRRDFAVWAPADCRQCQAGAPLEDPRSHFA